MNQSSSRACLDIGRIVSKAHLALISGDECRVRRWRSFKVTLEGTVTETASDGANGQPTTCGQGLAEHAQFPLKLGEVLASMAENLQLHMTALDLQDENSKREYDAYERLVQQHRQIAQSLTTTGKQMESYRDLPMGRHNERAMADSRVVDAFRNLVQREQELLALLGTQVKRHEQFLDQMSRASPRTA
jgi:hypothetical protein